MISHCEQVQRGTACVGVTTCSSVTRPDYVVHPCSHLTSLWNQRIATVVPRTGNVQTSTPTFCSRERAPLPQVREIKVIPHQSWTAEQQGSSRLGKASEQTLARVLAALTGHQSLAPSTHTAAHNQLNNSGPRGSDALLQPTLHQASIAGRTHTHKIKNLKSW